MLCPNCRHENDTGSTVCFGCGQRLQGWTSVTKGSLLVGRYEILSQLGRGGMGIVYRAHDRMLDEDVAIKLLRPDASDDEDLTRRFRSEIKLARKVTHRNVCRIHEYGEHDDLRYISMELIEGIDLRRLLRERPASTAKAFDLTMQSVQGLEAIHEVGIVHRDLKTPNIMRDTQGVVKLMDFGIAKRTGGDTATAGTATGLIMGTPEYMSPEQARGQAVDVRSDVYSMGIVIFEVFTGDVPFRADTPLATLFKHMEEAPPLEGPRAARIPPPLVPVLRRALAKERTDRFAKASSLLTALRDAAAESSARMTAGKAVTSSPQLEAKSTVPIAPTRALPRTAEAERQVEPPRSPLASPARSTARVFGLVGAGAVLALLVAAGYLGYEHMAGRQPAPNATVPAAELPRTTPEPIVPSIAPTDASPALPAEPALRPKVAPSSAPVAPAFPTRSPWAFRPSPSARATPRPAPSVPPSAPTIPNVQPSPLATTVTPSAPLRPPSPVSLEERGFLQVTVVPGAELVIDDQSHGSVTSKKVALSPGVHKVRLVSDDYQPYQRQITVLAGETAKLVVDLAEQAIRKR